MQKVKDNALRMLSLVKDVIPKQDALQFFNDLNNAYRESMETKKEIERINAHKEVLIFTITKKYDLYHDVFNKIFEERNQSINKSFEVIDKGIKEKNNELISMGLGSLSKIVSSSPFANIQELSRFLESGETIEI